MSTQNAPNTTTRRTRIFAVSVGDPSLECPQCDSPGATYYRGMIRCHNCCLETNAKTGECDTSYNWLDPIS